MWNGFKDSRAFTLIEVTIVIAIGALIILVVLQAVSNAQQNQRDNTRRQEGSQIASSLETYAANNQGEYPDESTVQSDLFGGGYTSQAIADTWTITGSQPAPDECDGWGSDQFEAFYQEVGPRDYQLWVCLEQGDEPVEIRDDT